jgi:hypothetical protein
MKFIVMNSIMVIKPYKHIGTWVFDDVENGLDKEPFVCGIPAMIDHMTQNIANAESGFRLLFSPKPFPQYQMKLEWVRPDGDGNWYFSSDLKMEGWLCGAMFKYFSEAPKELYAKAEAL